MSTAPTEASCRAILDRFDDDADAQPPVASRTVNPAMRSRSSGEGCR